MGYARNPEVIALAKLRMDRDGKEGDWDECVSDVFNGAHSGRSKVLDVVCVNYLNRAEQDMADVKLVLDSLSGSDAAP